MPVESNYTIAIATLTDWLTNLAPVFQPKIIKPKPIAPCARQSSRALRKLHIIARNSDWFMTLFLIVVIGRSNCYGIGFSTVI